MKYAAKTRIIFKSIFEKKTKAVSVSRSHVAINVISVKSLWTKHMTDGTHLFSVAAFITPLIEKGTHLPLG